MTQGALVLALADKVEGKYALAAICFVGIPGAMRAAAAIVARSPTPHE